MFSINQLNHFHLVAQTGSFAAAARKAHITQPALSNSISTLEDHIGLQLFDRSERPIRLTSGGRDLLARIGALLSEVRNLEREITYLSQGMAGELRIGMTAQSSGSIGGAILGTWQAENTRMSADVTVADTVALMDMLRAEQLDLIIGDARDLPFGSPDFDMRPIPEQQGRAFCRAGHPVLDLPRMSVHDLLPYRFAGAHFPVALLDRLVEMFDLPGRGSVDIAIECDNISVVRDAAVHSDLILLTTPGCVRDCLATKLLVELPIDLKTATSWHAVTLKQSVLHPAVASLRTVIDRAAWA